MRFFNQIPGVLPQRLRASNGWQDVMDLITYSGMAEEPDYLEIDGIYRQTLFMAGYPHVAHSGWLDPLVKFPHDIDVAYHIEQVEPGEALPRLRRKITELESTRRAYIRDGKIVGSELTDPLDSATELRDKIMRGQEKLFQVSVYITLSASSPIELAKIEKTLEAELGARLFLTKSARYRQTEGLQSILPRGEDQLRQKRNLDSQSAALLFPLASSELVQPTGILYGVNKTTSGLVIVDRFSLHNANSITFAQSGSGKSYAMKVEILRQLMQGTEVIVIDPEREYQNMALSAGGTHVTLSASSRQKINPLAYASSGGSVGEHIQDVAGFVSMIAGGLSAAESASLDKALLTTYQKARAPLLSDLYAELTKLNQSGFCERLEKYLTGSLAGVFDQATNVSLTNRLVVFDIKDLPESLREAMMLVVATYVQNEVKRRPRKRLLVIDEGWMLLEHEESARFVSSLTRRARKYYLGVAMITQQAADFLHNPHGRAIASQSSLRILMRQDTTSITHVSDAFHLSEWEEQYLLTATRGDALIIADSSHVAAKIVASSSEHPLITTDPSEVYE